MKLTEALEILNEPASENAPPLSVYLACGFTPLHLKTFLAAELRIHFGNRRVEIQNGLFGDLIGSLERLQPKGLDFIAVVLEWPDLDARLGIRTLGGWGHTVLPDVAVSVRRQIDRLNEAVRRLSPDCPMAFVFPTLPLPPIADAACRQTAAFDLELRSLLASFASGISGDSAIRILNAQRIDLASPLSERLDVKTEVTTGFPYKLRHASMLARELAALFQYTAPRKGLITDLDGTLWKGLLGEVGVDGIHWSLEEKSQMHGLYQQALRAMAEAGVLIGVASKNDSSLVAQAFQRTDLILSEKLVFPFEVHWGPKSVSVGRILKAWNILPDSVVFVDDSPMELAEVKSVYPEVECMVFPSGDHQGIWDLIHRLRELFGKSVVSDEDRIRLASIRQRPFPVEISETGGASEDFLQNVRASIRFNLQKEPVDPRVLELVNKTNQFNLAGRRFTDAEWNSYIRNPETILIVVSYEDKFGPLGKVAVLTARPGPDHLHVENWVMSCRAFSRRIEHRTLMYLFEKFGVEQVDLAFRATERNGPMREFLQEVTGTDLNEDRRAFHAGFVKRCPVLFHDVEEVVHV